jgi:hypothetical protein
MHTYTQASTHRHICTPTHTNTCIQTLTHTHVGTGFAKLTGYIASFVDPQQAHARTLTHTHTHTHAHIHAHIHAFTHAHIHCTYTHACTYALIKIHARLQTHTYTHMYTHTHTHTHSHTHTLIHSQAHIHTRILAHAHCRRRRKVSAASCKARTSDVMKTHNSVDIGSWSHFDHYDATLQHVFISSLSRALERPEFKCYCDKCSVNTYVFSALLVRATALCLGVTAHQIIEQRQIDSSIRIWKSL